MASQVRSVERHGDDVSRTGLDVAVASGAQVGLGGLVGLDASDVAGRGRGVVTHSMAWIAVFGARVRSAEERPGEHAERDHHRCCDVDVVPVRPPVLVVRVHAHA